MFLEPDPKRQKQSMSGFFSSQVPIISPRDVRQTPPIKRKPLHERTKSQNNSRATSRSPTKTVRLVQPSPSPSAHISSDSEDGKENRRLETQGKVARMLPHFDAAKDASVLKFGSPKPLRGYDVSGTLASANERVGKSGVSENNIPQLSFGQSTWDALRTVSDNYSQSSTLHVNDSQVSVGQKSDKRSRISEGTTLRDTPPPDEVIDVDTLKLKYTSSRPDPAPAPDSQPLQSMPTIRAVEESSPVRATVRAVSPSIALSSSPNFVAEPWTSPGEFLLRPQSGLSDSDIAPESSPESSNQRSSNDDFEASSEPRSLPNRDRPAAALGFYPSRESFAQSEATLPPSSSPNIVAFSSPYERARPRSSTHPLRYEPSFESIDIRLERSPSLRPTTGRSFATNNSLVTNSSNDTLPPLRVPKKRLRHMPRSHSLHSQATSSYSSRNMSYDDFDPEPYPRQQFSSHLSTIASESDRTTSQQLSQFSLGSTIWSSDDTSQPAAATWPAGRRSSGQHHTARPSPVVHEMSSEEEAGDMTLGIFRQPSLIPQPLFKEEASLPLHPFGNTRGAAKPSMLDVAESDEHVDTLSALQAPPLRQQRSGYSIRQRSNSTPSQTHSQSSHGEAERWSHGSTIFPTWAKHYYAGTAVLSTKVSMSTIATSRVRPVAHSRHGSTWTEHSSRLGTSHSMAESGRSRISRTFESPASTDFIPRIFRPRNRPRRDGVQSGRSRPSDESRPDSMAILPDPYVVDETGHEILPSGQPRWGILKDADAHRQPIGMPRVYSRQRDWDAMDFPRPMTQDEAEAYAIQYPRLQPSRRQGRPSTWRPPSFVESLDTLIHSRVNRQILLFTLGFICPFLWMLGAVLPLPSRPSHPQELGQQLNGSPDDTETAFMKRDAADAERRWQGELTFLKGKWWRMLNRVMSVVGVLVIAAIIALAVVATR